MLITVEPSQAFWALHPLMLYLLSMVRSHFLYIQQSKIPDGYQMVIQRRSSLRCSRSTRRVYPQSTVPVENGDPK